MSSTSTAISRLGAWRPTLPRDSALPLVVLIALLLGLIVTSRVSFALFYATGAGVLLMLGFVAHRFPRAMMAVVVFTPIVDRYIAKLVIPSSLHGVTTYLSEALLLVVAVVLGIRGLREQTLIPALRHPVVVALAAFGVVGAVSAIVNGVPPLVASAGIVFTVEAAALFVLPRVVGFSVRQAVAVAVAFTAMGTVAGALALIQVLVDPNFLGLETFSGRFNEGLRAAAFLVNPNMLGVVLAMSIPFPLLAAVGADRRRTRLLALGVTFMLSLALLYTFSRGAWLGLGVAGLVVGLVLDRRALVTLLLMAALAYTLAGVLPRHVLDPVPSDRGFNLGGATLGRLEPLADGTDLRIQFIRNALPIVDDHPIIGAGPGRYGGAVAWRFGTPLYDEYTDGAVPRNRTVDNFWLHITVEFGILGALILAAAMWLAVRILLGAGRRSRGWARIFIGSAAAVAIIVGVDSLAEMLLEGNTTSFATWFFLGVGSVLASRVPSVPPSSPASGAGQTL